MQGIIAVPNDSSKVGIYFGMKSPLEITNCAPSTPTVILEQATCVPLGMLKDTEKHSKTSGDEFSVVVKRLILSLPSRLDKPVPVRDSLAN